MTTSTNPWAARYRSVANLSAIRKRARVGAVALMGLDKLGIEVACRRLKDGFERIFVPTEQVCAILLTLIEMALAHAEVWYASDLEVCHRCYESNLKIDPVVPICLTGLSGAGKSALVKALERVLPLDSTVVLACTGDELPLIAMRAVNVKDKRGVRAVQTAIMRGSPPKEKSERDDGGCGGWMYRRGCCLLALDEMQFITQSENANVLVSQVILAGTYIGVPMVFVCNYSLCRRLLRRPSEAVQRVLTSPLLLMPDPPDSEDWHDILAECQKVAPGVFDFSLTERANELWSFSAGRKRDLVDLLVKSYRRARKRKSATVSWQTLEDTYFSVEFFASRRDVEDLMTYALTGDCPNKDLVSPFEGFEEAETRYRHQLKSSRSRRVADAANDAAMTESERKALAGIKKTKSPASSVVAGASRRKGVKTGATTAEELSRNAKLMLGDLGRHHRRKRDP